MEAETEKKTPDIIYHKGKLKAVILDIDDYEEILERLEDLEDLLYIQELRRRKTSYRDLDDILNEMGENV